MVHKLNIPTMAESLNLNIGDRVEISGIVYTARDAVMPKLTKLIEQQNLESLPISLIGSAVMHTAVSPAGFGPTSSNKEEIEEAMGILSKAGVRVHLGKGAISQETVNIISEYGSVFIAVPPISALLQSRCKSVKVAAFKEEGMEALHELVVERLPGVVAAANGLSIYNI